MHAPLIKLSAALACLVILTSCNGLPISFGLMSERERLKKGSDALLASCVESDAETPMTYRERASSRTAKAYLNYVARAAKKGGLSKYLTQEVLIKCLTGRLEGTPQGQVSDLVYRYGSDAQILAALKLEFSGSTDQEVYEYFDVFYPEDIAQRVLKIVSDDSADTIR
jgi:hypothetical protein